MAQLKDRVKQARLHAGLSQSSLARHAGVTQQVISTLERGITTSCREMLSIAQVCGVDIVWLETGQGDMVAGRSSAHSPEMPRLMCIAHLTASKQSLLAALSCSSTLISPKEGLALLEQIEVLLGKLSA